MWIPSWNSCKTLNEVISGFRFWLAIRPLYQLKTPTNRRMNPDIKVRTLRTFAEVQPHLSTVQSFADQNKSALGFLTPSAFREKAWGGSLWVALAEKSGEVAGYLLFGGVFPSLKIHQLFVSPSHRRHAIGSRLIKELVEFGEARGYLTISARVAADLRANLFWERLEFNLVRQEPGGKSAGRTINIRVRDLDTPSLLKGMDFAPKPPPGSVQELHFFRGPISRSPVYVLDLNVFFDVVRRRVHRKEGSLLIQAGLNHQISPRVTPEFTEELRRQTKAALGDPVLEFAQTLPTLPKIEHAELLQLLPELQSIVFPVQTPTGRRADRVHSDLTHLAYCVHHRATGFVTRDGAILGVASKLKQKYNLEIVSPADLVQPSQSQPTLMTSVLAWVGRKEVSVAVASESERGEVEQFLKTIGIAATAIPIVWDPGSSGAARARITVRSGDRLIGAVSWNSASRFKRTVNLYFYLDEANPEAERVIDHVFETVFRDSEPFVSRWIILHTSPEQSRTLATALQRGFVSLLAEDKRNHTPGLAKFSYRGVVTKETWKEFVNDFRRVTNLNLPDRLPTIAEFINSGVSILTAGKRPVGIVKLFDFETLASPAIVLCPGRTGLIAPIRPRFAQELFQEVDAQQGLFPSSEALLHVEKAYFRSPLNTKLFDRGLPILFYLSGGQGIIGSARITYSEVLPVGKVGVALSRQGVLSDQDLTRIADKSGNIHVFTFDNFSLFPNRVPFGFLRDNRLISGANLVTVEPLSHDRIFRIYKRGFGLEKIK